MKLVLKKRPDEAIEWNGTNINDVEEFIPSGIPFKQMDATTIMIDNEYEIKTGWYIIKRIDIIDNEIVPFITYADPETFFKIYDIKEVALVSNAPEKEEKN